MPITKSNPIRDALDKAAELHAAYLGAVASVTKTSSAGASTTKKAHARYQEIALKEQTKIDEAQEAADKAKQELLDFQNAAAEMDPPVGIDLLRGSSGRTAL